MKQRNYFYFYYSAKGCFLFNAAIQLMFLEK